MRSVKPDSVLAHASIAALVVSAGAMPATAGSFGVNLVVNGDAELGTSAGWISTGIDPGPAVTAGTAGLPVGEDIGQFSFTGALGPPTETLEQVIDVSRISVLIDSGGVAATFRTLVQSRKDGGFVDAVTGVVAFRDGGGTILESFTFGDIDIVEGAGDWEVVDDVRVVDAGVRSVSITYTVSREIGASTDAFFDNVEFTLALSCPADVDGDGAVGGSDLGVLLGSWGGSGIGDLDGSGVVDGGDLGLLLGAWGDCEP